MNYQICFNKGEGVDIFKFFVWKPTKSKMIFKQLHFKCTGKEGYQ